MFTELSEFGKDTQHVDVDRFVSFAERLRSLSCLAHLFCLFHLLFNLHPVALSPFRHVDAGVDSRLHQGLRRLPQHGARTDKRHNLATLHVAEGSRDESAL